MFKKFLLSFFILFLTQFSLFPVGGKVFRHQRVSVLRTRYFDIIFSEKSFESAKKIASVADSYYLEISKKLGTEPKARFPVTVTSDFESANGFFTPAPYNMIVLYDSFCDSPLDVSVDSVQDLFYHELTHAVTLNLKSKKYRVLSAIFGDFLTPAAFSMSYFWIEGAAVLFESKDGAGRLNNPFFTQLVTQAKIDSVSGVRKFPSWRDVAGARDIFPGGTDRYAFGACFADYLVEQYGLEKYSELWKNAGTSTNLSFVAGVFKKTYGKRLSAVWKEFEDSIKVNSLSTFSMDEEKSISSHVGESAFSQTSELISDSRCVVRALDFYRERNSKNFRLVFFDGKSGWVYLAEKKSSETSETSEKIKPKKLFYAPGVSRLCFNSDGSKIAVTRLVNDHTAVSEAGIFDLKNKKYRTVQKSGARDAFFAFEDGVEKLSSLDFNGNCPEQISSPVCDGNGIRLQIVRKALEWNIQVQQGEKCLDFGIPFIIKNLELVRFSDDSLLCSFVWAERGKNLSKLSRIGLFELDLKTGQGIFHLQNKNSLLNGAPAGVAYSVLSEKSGELLKFYAVSSEYEKNPLYEITAPASDFDRIPAEKIEKETLAVPAEDSSDLNPEEKSSQPSETENFERRRFNPLRHYLKGLRLPIGLVPVLNSNFSAHSTALLGATYAASTPWLDNLLILSGGYDPFAKAAGAYLILRGSDGLYSYSVSGTGIFDKEVFMQSNFSFSGSRILYEGLMNSFSAGASTQILFGHDADVKKLVRVQYQDSEELETKIARNRNEGIFTSSSFNLTFSNIHKVSQNTNQLLGVKIQPFLLYQYDDYERQFRIEGGDYRTIPLEGEYLNAGLSVYTRVPFIFPLTFQAELFPEKDYFFGVYARALLFSLEIQKGIPAVSLFLNRITLSASYTGLFGCTSGKYWDIKRTDELFRNFERQEYSDRVFVNLSFDFCPNTGYFADPTCQFSLGGAFIYRPNPQPGQPKITVGVTSAINL